MESRFKRIAKDVVDTCPRIKLLGKVRSFAPDGRTMSVWQVDGVYIRKNIDEEFTNYAQPLQYDFVPKDEFWIDEEANNDETDFFVEHLLVEHGLMAQGISYDKALMEAGKAEKALRRSMGDIDRMTEADGVVNSDMAKLSLLNRLEGVDVWLVDGRLVRSALDINFTEGGHDYVYDYVPNGEVWIDNDVVEGERGFILYHELHERNRMKDDGWEYSKAHDESSKLELKLRKKPEGLQDALGKEGWMGRGC